MCETSALRKARQARETEPLHVGSEPRWGGRVRDVEKVPCRACTGFCGNVLRL